MLTQFLLYAKFWLMGLGMTEEEGQGLVEYALIIVLVSIVVIAVLFLLGEQIGNVFQSITGTLGEYTD